MKHQVANLFEVIIAAVLVAVAIALERVRECYSFVKHMEASLKRRLFHFNEFVFTILNQ
jgi:hypothetical protein